MLGFLDWMPEIIGGIGHDIDGVIRFIFYIIIPWFLLAEAILFYFIIRYRRKEGVKAHYEAGKTLKALSWILIPAALVLICDLVIDAVGTATWNRVKVELPEDAMHVRAVGAQFFWKFTHPGPDNQLDTDDDLVMDNDLHVPSGKPIVFELESTDVIHSFFVPGLRLKQDVVPGRRIKGWFQADQAGRVEIACAELCGLGHTKMRGWLNVHEPEAFQEWQKTALAKKTEEADVW